MHLAILSTSGGPYTWAGSEEMWRILAEEALKRGCRVTAYLKSEFSGSEELNKLHALGGETVAYGDLGWVQRRLSDNRLYNRFRSIARLRPQVLCLSGPPEAPARHNDLYALLRGYDGPVVYIIQGNDSAFIRGDVVRSRLRELYCRAAVIVCVSNENARLLQMQLAARLSNIRILPNPIRIEMNEPLEWPGRPDGAATFATVGRYEVWSKGQDLVLEAFAAPEWKHRDWRLNLYGSGPDAQYIAQLITYFGISKQAFLRVHERDFRNIWRSNQMHVLCSRAEGLALALIESMFCGRPAIVTRTGGNHELVRDGKDGFVSPGMNLESISETLERAWKARSHWQEMGGGAFFRAEQSVPRDLASRIFDAVCSAARVA